MTYFMYIAFLYLPVRSGFLKVFLDELIISISIITFSKLSIGCPFSLPHLLITSVIVAVIIGFDFNGTTPTRKSDRGGLLGDILRQRIHVTKP